MSPMKTRKSAKSKKMGEESSNASKSVSIAQTQNVEEEEKGESEVSSFPPKDKEKISETVQEPQETAEDDDEAERLAEEIFGRTKRTHVDEGDDLQESSKKRQKLSLVDNELRSKFPNLLQFSSASKEKIAALKSVIENKLDANKKNEELNEYQLKFQEEINLFYQELKEELGKTHNFASAQDSEAALRLFMSKEGINMRDCAFYVRGIQMGKTFGLKQQEESLQKIISELSKTSKDLHNASKSQEKNLLVFSNVATTLKTVLTSKKNPVLNMPPSIPAKSKEVPVGLDTTIGSKSSQVPPKVKTPQIPVIKSVGTTVDATKEKQPTNFELVLGSDGLPTMEECCRIIKVPAESMINKFKKVIGKDDIKQIFAGIDVETWRKSKNESEIMEETRKQIFTNLTRFVHARTERMKAKGDEEREKGSRGDT